MFAGRLEFEEQVLVAAFAEGEFECIVQPEVYEHIAGGDVGLLRVFHNMSLRFNGYKATEKNPHSAATRPGIQQILLFLYEIDDF